jgi:hypothetical protein
MLHGFVDTGQQLRGRHGIAVCMSSCAVCVLHSAALSYILCAQAYAHVCICAVGHTVEHLGTTAHTKQMVAMPALMLIYSAACVSRSKSRHMR